ncbi:peptidase S45 [Actinomycetospora sp. NBRC 106375]|uniref:penicillin acylase family protein n=1 Tax=Actinomycetospora sp. NBRC 106375 TaxID=3032207 RepID=UPI0024A244E5|nr:penicillin acylase family protein [Actinomycetospora sp. NBRC 106375]GLZ48402.1 peptidase S45 [Actinomycetospora sp. NBRC 106375]
MPDDVEVAGLEHSVEVIVDRWGVPHVYAGSAHDAFLAQGFQAARDRLFQIDLWRRRGLGRLAEVFGPEHLDQDRARRLLLHRGGLDREWAAYPDTTREIVGAFVDGVNAYVDWALVDPGERLPPEFAALGHTPARWRPEDVVRIRTHGLFYNVEQELARALTVRDLGVAAEELRAVRGPDGPLVVPDPAVLEHLGEHVLDVYRRAFEPVDLAGSNNWVVAGHRTATGRPVLANDPHRAITVPSLRYLAHLEAPGLSVIGAGEPALPGISIGHNGRVAFGLTIWPIDHEDLLVYALHPTDDGRYGVDGGWADLEVVEEDAGVAGAVHTLAFTRDGPVLHVDTEARVLVALRAAWLEPGMAPYLASLAHQDAADVHAFRAALAGWGAPGVNQVFADVHGSIGVQACGRVPRRAGWDGALPVPGDGRFPWAGVVPLDELPGEIDPAAGALTTSNQDTGDASGATVDWYSSARHERLAAWLAEDTAVDVAASLRWQTDELNAHGRALLDRLAGLEVPGPWWAELQAWDGVEDAGSRAALLFQVWMRRHWRPWLAARCLEHLGHDPAAVGRLARDDALFSDLRPDLRMLEVVDPATLADGVAATLRAALTEIEGLLGADPASWSWGALHRTELRHPVLPDASLPPVPRSGSGDTVGLAGHDATFNAVMGSSFRMALDVGDWDRSRVLNAPGQSGDPRSPHYADLLDRWAAGDAFPLVYTRAAVEEAAEHRLILRPAPS